MMRGTDEMSGSLFSYVDLEARIPARHPLRKLGQVVNDALAGLDAELETLYTGLLPISTGQPGMIMEGSSLCLRTCLCPTTISAPSR